MEADLNRALAYLDALLAELGCTVAQTNGAPFTLAVGVGTDRDALIAGLARIIVGQRVKVKPLPAAAHRPGTCRDCGQDVLFLRSAKSGRWIPTDRRPTQQVMDDGTIVRPRGEYHGATCPMRNRVAADRAAAQHKAAVSGEVKGG